MCGIAGIIHLNHAPVDAPIVHAMLDAIAHRGPDGRGQHVDGPVGLGHVRLSIIDLSSTADQPLHTADGDLSIVFNGEIYNYRELRAQLQHYEFRTGSDTEVILAAYRQWGDGCLHRLNGMFSFVIHDRKGNRVFGARDRFGIKPFYYCHDRDRFVFASEIKGVLASGAVQARLNEEVLYDFIVFNRTDHTAHTSFKDVLNLRPGHQLVIDLSTNAVHISAWYLPPEPEEGDWDFDAARHLLRTHLEDSMALHLVSDVPVAASLSGGIDSSTVVSLMRKVLPQGTPIHTFSAVYDDGWDRNERPYMEVCAQEKRLTPHYLRPDADGLLRELDELILQQEEPFGSASLYASWCVFKEAGRHGAKVMLSGQGADEVFAYDYMAAFYFVELFRGFKWATLLREMLLFHRKQAQSMFTFKLFVFLLMPGFVKDRLIAVSDSTVSREYLKRFKGHSTYQKEFLSATTLNGSVRKHLLMKLHHHLREEDKSSMRFGVESRVPFLEYRLVEFGLRVPARFKVRHGEVKHILKEAMRNLLPDKVYRRNNKIGYETPMDDWFRTPGFVTLIDGMLADPHQPMASRLNMAVIRERWEAHKAGHHNHGAALWKYLYLTRWHQLYFETFREMAVIVH